MQQLILDITPTPPPTFGNFVTAANSELIDALLLNHEPQLYLWGAPGSGKTHLLRACVRAAHDIGHRAAYVDAENVGLTDDQNVDLLALDNVEKLDATNQIKLFNLINRVREGQGRLIAAGCAAPMLLPLREDLTTRLGWSLVYQVHSLSDNDKLQALSRIASERGFELQAGVADYLMRHWRRDLASLIGAIERLDRYSVQTRRPVTVLLLKEILVRSATESSQ